MNINRIKNFLHLIVDLFFKIFPIKRNKIMFLSGGTSYSCNPKYISEYIADSNKYDVVWVFHKNIYDNIKVPQFTRKIKYKTIRYYYEINTARIIIDNHRLNFHKRKGQKYIQTWHSSMRLKKIEGDAADSLDLGYIKMAKKDSENIDLIISGCDFSTDFFKRAFWYDGEIAKVGTPRIDFLFNKENALKSQEKTKKEFGINSEFVLYAPTFRKNKGIEFYDIDADKITSLLKEKENTEIKVLTKLHPNLINMMDGLKKQESLINASYYNDTQELILASKLVITDYSSLMFDCAFIHKPCILYMPDFEEYISKERGLYFDIKELPFPKAFTTEELLEKIKSFDIEEYKINIDKFLKTIGSYEDGRASERVANIIDKMIGEKR